MATTLDQPSRREAQVYLALSALGAVTAYGTFGAFLVEHGFDIELFFASLRHNSWAMILVVDLVLCTVYFLVWSYRDSKRHGIGGWPLVLALTAFVALSCGAPAYLYLRARQLAGAAT